MSEILVHGKPIDYDARDLLPAHIRDSVRRYVEKGINPGSFLTSVVSNDLFEAVGRADDVNRHRLFDICSWFYGYAPPACFGSEKRVKAWVERQKKQ